MKLGARIFKTGLAIIISLYVATMLELDPIVLAPLGAIFALQPSIYRSYQSILEQVQGNLIGAVVAIILMLTLGNEPIVIGLASIIVIIIHLKFKLENAIPLALVSAVVIMESATGGEIASVAVTRFTLIMIGVLSAFIVNLMFVPPKYENKLFHQLLESTEDTIRWLKLIAKHGSQHLVLKKDIERLEKKRFTIDQFYIFYKEERVYLAKKRFKKARKLVAFRNMMASQDQAMILLKTMHHYENALQELPLELRERIEDEIDCLTELHEQLLNIFIGKIKTKLPNDTFKEEVSINKVKVTNTFFSYFKEKDDDELTTRFLPLLGAFVKYSEELEHLNKLVNSYNSFHFDKFIDEQES
ncbi:hypothetical protein CIB95_09950 [Lottiidibacillus patelloidae]|uniref:Uncharacterized protein n=1 Tax=Lottiidibacillus patelloidae TaxID=2670334 RepID=A0A263BUS7_9BACI|nr:aromatic acid exporter family protein [Lottiidibacillus patelloidae]OZM57077.1 hypothetical protein CIB95_09950 [Lottiidibacillus patelloidae]